MMLLAFLRANWRVLAFVLGTLLGVLVLTQGWEYGRALLARHGLRKAQDQASSAHAQQQATAAARYTGYRLDSIRRATERRPLVDALHLSQLRDAQIDSQRPARVPLPAFSQLPRE